MERAPADSITNLPVDRARLWSDVMALAEITEPDRPYTRRSFSPMFLRGREWLAARFRAAGLAVRIDAAGNLIGRREGEASGAKAIMIGSHSDTVPSGGRFDGIAGVLAGLEIARSLQDCGIALQHPLEIVDFLAEEPSEYGLSCVGSRGMAGALDAKMLAFAGPDDETLGSAIARVGGTPESLTTAQRADIAAFLELHIEQGPVLENRGIDIGVVTAIAGILRVEIVVTGEAAHAGTAPMHARRDAAVAGARMMVWIRDEARNVASEAKDYFVATTGIVEVKPNAANVVPGDMRLVVDVRSEARALSQGFADRLRAKAAEIAAEEGVVIARFAVLSDSEPSRCDVTLRETLSASAQELGLSVVPIASGAGHDAAFLSRIAPAAMVFIPCRGGRSHCPEEWADEAALAAGAAVLFNAVRKIDAQPQPQSA